LFQLEKQGGAV